MPDLSDGFKPYETEVLCPTCEKQPMICRAQYRHGTAVERQLTCKNADCGAVSQDLYDPSTKKVLFNKQMDSAANFPNRALAKDKK
jgi:hypothetical protein